MNPAMPSGPIHPALMEYADLLREMPLFKGVEEATIQTLLGRCEKRSVEAGEILVRPDTPIDQMYLILKGKVNVHLDSVDREPLTSLSAGECVGEMSMFDGKAPSAFVRVVEPSEMLVLKRELLWELIDMSHAVARNLLYLLSQRLRATNLAMTEIQEQKRRHERAASRDGLTGLHNRGWLERILARIDDRTLAPYLPLSIIMLDVDQFKTTQRSIRSPGGRRRSAEAWRTVAAGRETARYGGPLRR